MDEESKSNWEMPELTPERIQECREWIARHKAELDQHKKQFEAQYPMVHPRANKMRLYDLEATEFWISIHEWELEEMLKNLEEE